MPTEAPHWEACRVEYNHRGLIKADRVALKKAVRRIESVSNIRFTKGQSITIKYKKIPDRSVLGIGGYTYIGKRIISGHVYLSARYKYRLSKKVRVDVLTHELGHTLGVWHINQRNSVMSPVQTKNTRWTVHDRKAFSSLKCG